MQCVLWPPRPARIPAPHQTIRALFFTQIVVGFLATSFSAIAGVQIVVGFLATSFSAIAGLRLPHAAGSRMKRTRGLEAAAESAVPLTTLLLRAADGDPCGPTAAHLAYCGAVSRELRAAEPYVIQAVRDGLVSLLPRAYGADLRPSPGSGLARVRRTPDNLASSLDALHQPDTETLTSILTMMLDCNRSFAKVVELGLPPLRRSDFAGGPVPVVGIVYGVVVRVPADCVSGAKRCGRRESYLRCCPRPAVISFFYGMYEYVRVATHPRRSCASAMHTSCAARRSLTSTANLSLTPSSQCSQTRSTLPARLSRLAA